MHEDVDAPEPRHEVGKSPLERPALPAVGEVGDEALGGGQVATAADRLGCPAAHDDMMRGGEILDHSDARCRAVAPVTTATGRSVRSWASGYDPMRCRMPLGSLRGRIGAIGRGWGSGEAEGLRLLPEVVTHAWVSALLDDVAALVPLAAPPELRDAVLGDDGALLEARHRLVDAAARSSTRRPWGATTAAR